jgi:hypothetical protein
MSLTGNGVVGLKTPYGAVLLEKLIVTRLVKRFPAVMEPGDSFP